ncbi:cupin domain-containing protein [Amycolatopsis acidiphila]|uniref:Cupin domain-containing protein n=1 Tax=Amycolatopsis acidiphila TaxID=715473 RepID=A0A558AK01_9PSEU|nr:cupin domain-containing protein [Amycolatopsis acidiphila]TVT24597.1 cupin domain-containing protein [Amycolatopsis acidiphila]UIJ58545.1 cupin domain-containing protein [Amycolatopsis acidiphila]GHG76927.1 gentisate 1,2-dioxygenase [Amycolatopsis acidiphila]
MDVDEAALARLYKDFDAEHMIPLWTQTGELMPMSPTSKALPHVWKWDTLLPLAERAGALVPVGRGGERRAIALANPGLAGHPYTTPTLWTAIQYLGPNEVAPEHRHSQNAFRFVVEGEGVWTVVNGDPVAMRRGDFLLTPGWHFHGHHNETDQPMAWLDGLDIPLVHYTDTGFFEFGSDKVTDWSTPDVSRSERLWAHPGLRPLSGSDARPSSPIAAYRWEHTDRALNDQLALEDEGHPGVAGPGHAAVRFTNPTTGGDVMPTIRAEFHRLREGAETATKREVGSAVWQVFDGEGEVTLGEKEIRLGRGDLFVVPSWVPVTVRARTRLDLFRFADTPIFVRLHQYREETTR